MHDLALHPAGRDSGTADACLFGLFLCSGASGLGRLGRHSVDNVQRKTGTAAAFVAGVENTTLGPAPDRGLVR